MTSYEPRAQRPAHENEIRQTELKLGSYEGLAASGPSQRPMNGAWAYEWQAAPDPVYITHIRLAGGDNHTHISDVVWRKGQELAQSTREAIVEWIRDEGGDARVVSGGREVSVGVVDASPPYIRAYANSAWTDDLLDLPRF
jgi:hypothetical protein